MVVLAENTLFDADLDGDVPRDADPPSVACYDIDARLVEVVRSKGPDSHEYRYLQNTLEDVGVGTLTNLGKDHRLHGEVLRRGGRLCQPIPPTYSEHFRFIVYVAVRTAAPPFMQNQVMGNGWSAAGRASIKTFFVTAAMYRYADEYNRFWREEAFQTDDVAGSPDVDLVGEHARAVAAADPEFVVVARDLIRRSVPPRTSPAVRRMLVRTAQGYTQAEIATELGVSAEAVSSAIRRLRRHLDHGQEGAA